MSASSRYKIITDLEEAELLWPLGVLYTRWCTHSCADWGHWPSDPEEHMTPHELWDVEYFTEISVGALVEEDNEE